MKLYASIPPRAEVIVVPSAAAGLFMVDFIVRPFAKIYEKMPLVMLLVIIVLYSIVGYFVLKSAYMADEV